MSLCDLITITVQESETEGMWYAKVEEYDLMGDGDSPGNAVMELGRVINVHVAVSKELGKVPLGCVKNER